MTKRSMIRRFLLVALAASLVIAVVAGTTSAGAATKFKQTGGPNLFWD